LSIKPSPGCRLGRGVASCLAKHIVTVSQTLNHPLLHCAQ